MVPWGQIRSVWGLCLVWGPGDICEGNAGLPPLIPRDFYYAPLTFPFPDTAGSQATGPPPPTIPNPPIPGPHPGQVAEVGGILTQKQRIKGLCPLSLRFSAKILVVLALVTVFDNYQSLCHLLPLSGRSEMMPDCPPLTYIVSSCKTCPSLSLFKSS